jgi:hypothetical protein
MTFNITDPTQLSAALQELNDRVTQLATANEHLTAQNQALNSQLRTAPPREPKEPKITLPEKFDGARANYRGFINQLRLAFQMSPSRYGTDAIKIATVGSLLNGDALAWYNPFIEQPAKHQVALSSWANFFLALNSAFADPDMECAAEAKIRTLRQGRTAAITYASKFKQTAADLTWNDTALISQFKSGLSESVKDMMVYQDPLPTTLENFINLAIRLDNRVFERDRDKRRGADTPVPPRTNPAHNGPVPMDIDALKTRRGPLSPEERTRRFNNQLCMFCGETGHFKYNCPAKSVTGKKQAASMSTEPHGDIEKPNQDFQ